MPPSSTLVHSTSSSLSHKQRKRRWTRNQLLECIEMLNDVPLPLPLKIPSPPSSRSTSPAPGNKRKPDSSLSSDHVKRIRTSSILDRQHLHLPHPSVPQSSQQPVPSLHSSSGPSSQLSSHSRPFPPSIPSSRFEPCEDGEVREDLPPQDAVEVALDSGLLPLEALPIRRPKKDPKPEADHFDQLHNKYHNVGRMLKYSGDARWWSTYPPTHREYRPLQDPPPVGSLYHKHGALIARLELVDALVSFTYSIWARDYSRKSCCHNTWSTSEAFLNWCKAKWHAEDSINDAEKAFLGLIYMIEAFINGRKMLYNVRQTLDPEMTKVTDNAKRKLETTIQDIDQGSHLGTNTTLTVKPQGTPTMLPSPASIAPSNSANSTPTNRDGGTPNPVVRPPPATQNPPSRQPKPQEPPQPFYNLLPRKVRESKSPVPPAYLDAAASITETIDSNTICNLKDLTTTFRSTAHAMQESQNTLTLPIMARHFPRTFRRMMYSTLSPNEEYEPDFEDEEGELFWPGQLATGEGLGWVCLMGKAMIKEFGRAYGYKGVAGVVPKPTFAENGGSSQSAPPNGLHHHHLRPHALHPPPQANSLHLSPSVAR